MPRPSKIVNLALEQVVLTARGEGLTLAAIVDRCNDTLMDRESAGGRGGVVAESAVRRYMKTLDAASVAPAHSPQLAQEAAEQAIDVTRDFRLLHGNLKTWLEEVAQSGQQIPGVFYDVNARQVINAKQAAGLEEEGLPGEVVGVFTADWSARTMVAREFREALKLWADLLERIHNAEQIALFQQTVMEAIEAADPETAKAIRDTMREKQSIRRAALLGVA